MHALHSVLGKEKLESRPTYWYCHCCLKQNKVVHKDEAKNMCVTCGRPSTYTQDGYALPLHGKGVQVYRPVQVVNVLENLDESDMFDWTGLHSAAVKGNAPVVKELLELGCIVDARTKHHQTALHLAVYAGSLPSVKLLIEAGANVSRVTHLEQVSPISHLFPFSPNPFSLQSYHLPFSPNPFFFIISYIFLQHRIHHCTWL